MATGGEEAESVVEKRLKQNREAARRSRDRKRRLKEELRSRIPMLQEEHDMLTDQVDDVMKHLWVRVHHPRDEWFVVELFKVQATIHLFLHCFLLSCPLCITLLEAEVQ
jgi:uncharacterized protein YhaN